MGRANEWTVERPGRAGDRGKKSVRELAKLKRNAQSELNPRVDPLHNYAGSQKDEQHLIMIGAYRLPLSQYHVHAALLQLQVWKVELINKSRARG